MGIQSETASFDPGLRSRLFAILDVALLRLRFQKNCGLALSRNATFEKSSILFKYKAGENFNHRHTLSISRIKIFA